MCVSLVWKDALGNEWIKDFPTFEDAAKKGWELYDYYFGLGLDFSYQIKEKEVDAL